MSTAVRRALAAGLVLLAGCSVPTGGDAETIPSSEVPYGLLSTSPAPAPPSSSPQTGQAQVYLLGPDDVLVPGSREARGAGPRERLGDLLRHLAAGPTAAEQAAELATVLAPGTGLSVTALDGGTATVDLTGPGEAPTGREARLAVGQIVLTATSLPDVDAVLLTWDGQPLEAPLPTGELRTGPLTAADYEALSVAPPP